jgi:hypothetical protein
MQKEQQEAKGNIGSGTLVLVSIAVAGTAWEDGGDDGGGGRERREELAMLTVSGTECHLSRLRYRHQLAQPLSAISGAHVVDTNIFLRGRRGGRRIEDVEDLSKAEGGSLAPPLQLGAEPSSQRDEEGTWNSNSVLMYCQDGTLQIVNAADGKLQLQHAHASAGTSACTR